MVRLEKIKYEKIFNSKILGRHREIDVPRKEDYNQEVYLREIPLLPKFITKIFDPICIKLV